MMMSRGSVGKQYHQTFNRTITTTHSSSSSSRRLLLLLSCNNNNNNNNNRRSRWWSSPPPSINNNNRSCCCSLSCSFSSSKSIMASAATSTNNNNNNNNNNKWVQKTVTLRPHPRGCHLITPHCNIQVLLSPSTKTMTPMFDTTLRPFLTPSFLRDHPLHGNTLWKVPMTCHHTSNHQCLAVRSRSQSQRVGLTWGLGREYGYASTETWLLHAQLSSPSMEFNSLD